MTGGGRSSRREAGNPTSGVRKTNRRVRVLLADDHPVVLNGMKACLKGYSHLEVVGEARNGLEAIKQARTLVPDLVLMDLEMPQMNGLAAIEILREEMPQLKVLILSSFGNPEYVRAAVQSGAHGYLLKDVEPREIIRAIDVVDQGGTFFSVRPLPRRTGVPNGARPLLSKRETEVLVLIASGLSNQEIATRFSLGVRTVETHRQALMRKLDIHSIAGLTRFAVARGLISADTAPTQALA
jgi:two-component system, NarL family, nitrate/nitrite response regulator NarL